MKKILGFSIFIFAIMLSFIILNPISAGASSNIKISDTNFDKNSPTVSGKTVKTSNHMDNVIKNFDKYVSKTFTQSGIPGAAVVVVHNGQIKYLKCLGVKDVKTKEPVNPNTLFQIGSCSKAFTSTTIAQLVDKGVMKWDDKVKKYYPNTQEFLLPGKTLTNQVTIRDLLSHRTGMPAYGSGGDQLWITFNEDYPNMLYKMRYIKPSAQLRSLFQYNNIMYALAGECEVRATGTSWSDLVKQNLLKPLKMNTATTTYQEFIKVNNRAHTYNKFYNKYIENSVSDIDSVGPAGSMGVSIKEMANWLNFQLADGKFRGKQLVSLKSLLETRKPQIYMGEKGSYYGMGWTINNERGVINHAGDALPSKTIVEFSPSQKWGIAIYANEGNYGLGFNGALEAAFTQLYKHGKIIDDKWPTAKKTGDNLVSQYYLSKKAKPKPPLTPAQNLNYYTGTYTSQLYGNIKVVRSGEYLKIYQGKNNQPVTLQHWNGNTFRVIYPIVTSSIYSNVVFKSTHGRQANQVAMAIYYAFKTNGTFKRTYA